MMHSARRRSSSGQGTVRSRARCGARSGAALPHRAALSPARARGLGERDRGRRGWATARKHLPAKDVAFAGGWKNVATLQTIYQQPDPESTYRAVRSRSRFGRRRRENVHTNRAHSGFFEVGRSSERVILS